MPQATLPHTEEVISSAKQQSLLQGGAAPREIEGSSSRPSHAQMSIWNSCWRRRRSPHAQITTVGCCCSNRLNHFLPILCVFPAPPSNQSNIIVLRWWSGRASHTTTTYPIAHPPPSSSSSEITTVLATILLLSPQTQVQLIDSARPWTK